MRPFDQAPLKGSGSALSDPTQQSLPREGKLLGDPLEMPPPGVSMPQKATPEPLSAAAVTPADYSLPVLLDVRFLNEREGWILASDVVLHTTDAGNT
jgi:hypothetical protein